MIVRLVLLLATLSFSFTGCTTFGPHPSAELTTLSPAWPRWFALDWTRQPEPSGTSKVSGYVQNALGEEAIEVQLLTQALDKSGAVVGQRITWAGTVPGFSRTYFEVRNLPAAETYQVSVWAFSLHQSIGWQ